MIISCKQKIICQQSKIQIKTNKIIIIITNKKKKNPNHKPIMNMNKKLIINWKPLKLMNQIKSMKEILLYQKNSLVQKLPKFIQNY